MELKRICVFCGSSPGRSPIYMETAVTLGRAMAARKIGLVYGGASVGLMGAVADAVMQAGGDVIGIIPQALIKYEVAHRGLPDLRVVHSMHDRKAAMADLADGFIAMPGALGTLDEFFEVLTWSQLGEHSKPCGLLDVAGYYSKMLAFLDHAVDERFLRAEHRAMLLVETEVSAMLDRLASYVPPKLEKMDRSLLDLKRVTDSAQNEIFERGIDLFNEGRFFECHEAWEEIWLRAEGAEKLFLQGMIQAAVAILHAQRGNLVGARGQYAKSCAKLDSIASAHRGIAMDQFRADLLRFFETALRGETMPASPKIRRTA